MADRHLQRALSDFLAEAQEVVDALDRGLVDLEDRRSGEEADPQALNTVFRAAHTLKGLAAMFGADRIAALAHALEDRLDDLRMGRRPFDQATLEVVLAAPALFARLVGEEAAQARTGALEAEAVAMALRLRGHAGASPAEAADPIDGLAIAEHVRKVLTEYEEHRLRTRLRQGATVYSVVQRFDLATFDTGLDDLKQRLEPVGEVMAALPSADEADPDGLTFDLLLGTAEPVEAVKAVAGAAAEVKVVPRRASGGAPGAAERRAGSDRRAASAPVEVERRASGERRATLVAAERPALADGAAVPGRLLEQPLPARPLPPAPPLGEPARLEARSAPALSTPALGPASEAAGEQEPASPARPPAAAVPRAVEVAAPETSLRSVSQVVRVDIGKLDRLMNLVGELVLVKTSVLGIAERLRSGDGSTTLGLELHRESRALDRKLDELQGGILEVRMVPLEQVFDKLSRMARKLARDLDKQVELVVAGGDVELDKLIVEELSDPLMHLVRNALDHAIEPPADRLRAGKPSRGTVRLRAEQKGSHVVITVEDDGAGIDEARVRDEAQRRGLVAPEALAQLSRREALNLVFMAGFSTKRDVSSLSGRGVGMDVVKNNIAAMSGIIDLETELGAGTRFQITLPVTLAIVRALVVAVAGRTYAVPLNSVLEVLTVAPSSLRTLSGREVVSLRGATLPLLRLGRHFAHGPALPDGGPLSVVVVGLAQERLALAVDGLVGQQDIVVKPLGKALAGVRGIAGATDLGGRRTVLVLDVGALIEEVLHLEALAEVT